MSEIIGDTPEKCWICGKSLEDVSYPICFSHLRNSPDPDVFSVARHHVFGLNGGLDNVRGMKLIRVLDDREQSAP